MNGLTENIIYKGMEISEKKYMPEQFWQKNKKVEIAAAAKKNSAKNLYL